MKRQELVSRLKELLSDEFEDSLEQIASAEINELLEMVVEAEYYREQNNYNPNDEKVYLLVGFDRFDLDKINPDKLNIDWEIFYYDHSYPLTTFLESIKGWNSWRYLSDDEYKELMEHLYN